MQDERWERPLTVSIWMCCRWLSSGPCLRETSPRPLTTNLHFGPKCQQSWQELTMAVAPQHPSGLQSCRPSRNDDEPKHFRSYLVINILTPCVWLGRSGSLPKSSTYSTQMAAGRWIVTNSAQQCSPLASKADPVRAMDWSWTRWMTTGCWHKKSSWRWWRGSWLDRLDLRATMEDSLGAKAMVRATREEVSA